MIRRFLLISGAGGLVLFRKSFELSGRSQSQDGGLLSGLITALVDFTLKNVGMSVLHMQFDNVGVHIVDTVVNIKHNHRERVICFLLCDAEDSERFGHLIASELLLAFVDEYSEKLSDMRAANVENFEAQFREFSSKIYFVIENSIAPVMRELERHAGIKRAELLKRSILELDQNMLGSVWYPALENNQTGILAELQNFLNVADDILSDRGGQMRSARIGDHIEIRSLRRATLALIYRSAADIERTYSQVESSISLLNGVFDVLDFLKGN
eukprot:Plantae.Rhodophyta-Purpureofilum_apyrenoidigerum.ctg16217.p1 GENE.Plantae.Rhodophyta-Purpureofilum_apyrenoidigerum.ctg16217~~Plantae.Rhodophyta-Purpureofilum_apyrenoidigerum.ctg16217.p1  ORF type:complete len:270 (+),score=54.73 Plantae.Rhodophyta-Purpureofilum_apyrenoidigerum.ctg16217:186-995(+)